MPTSPKTPGSATFATTVAANGTNTGIEVPPEVLDQLGAGKRPAVLVSLDGYEYRNTVGSVDGRAMISVSAAARKATGLSGGDPVTVTLTVADTPREVVVPDDLQAAFAEQPGAEAFFRTLSNSLQRFHIDSINGAKSPETRQRRIDKSIGLFLAGKPR
jgi:Bacteriocin-protection, YdeI or OmpD-Associated/Domain of unknown function (DUF1905)